MHKVLFILPSIPVRSCVLIRQTSEKLPTATFCGSPKPFLRCVAVYSNQSITNLSSFQRSTSSHSTDFFTVSLSSSLLNDDTVPLEMHLARGETSRPSIPIVPEESGANTEVLPQEDPLVQYIVLRKDLIVGLNWPLGSVISQGCHAAVAAIWLHKEDPVTQQYCAAKNLDNMYKWETECDIQADEEKISDYLLSALAYQVTLEVKGEAQLRVLAQKLESEGIVHKLWIEQPENYATCLATKPYHKSHVASYFKKLKLFK